MSSEGQRSPDLAALLEASDNAKPWRDDPAVREFLRYRERRTAGSEATVDASTSNDEPTADSVTSRANPNSTLVLVNGTRVSVPLGRAAAIEAGYTVLDSESATGRDGDADGQSPRGDSGANADSRSEGSNTSSPGGGGPVPAGPASRSREDVNAWLRALSSAAGTPGAVAPGPVRVRVTDDPPAPVVVGYPVTTVDPPGSEPPRGLQLVRPIAAEVELASGDGKSPLDSVEHIGEPVSEPTAPTADVRTTDPTGPVVDATVDSVSDDAVAEPDVARDVVAQVSDDADALFPMDDDDSAVESSAIATPSFRAVGSVSFSSVVSEISHDSDGASAASSVVAGPSAAALPTDASMLETAFVDSTLEVSEEVDPSVISAASSLTGAEPSALAETREATAAPPLLLGAAGLTMAAPTALHPPTSSLSAPPSLSAPSGFRISVGETDAASPDGFMDDDSSTGDAFNFVGSDRAPVDTETSSPVSRPTDDPQTESEPSTDHGSSANTRTVIDPAVIDPAVIDPTVNNTVDNTATDGLSLEHNVDASSAAPVAARSNILSARDVSKTFNGPHGIVDVLRSIDLTIEAGEFLVITGPSGSGKTTLLHCLSGLDSIDEGEVVIDGESIHLLSDAERTTQRGEVMGFIFQAYHLVPGMTAVENVELPLLLNGWTTEEAREEATAALQLVGLTERADHLPAALSGGEQQRVTIARALVGEPQIVWADEPTGNLDEDTAATILDLLTELHAEGLTIVMVTHDATIAKAADRRVVLRDGRIVADDRDPHR